MKALSIYVRQYLRYVGGIAALPYPLPALYLAMKKRKHLKLMCKHTYPMGRRC